MIVFPTEVHILQNEQILQSLHEYIFEVGLIYN